jgi:hypothetical protein
MIHWSNLTLNFQNTFSSNTVLFPIFNIDYVRLKNLQAISTRVYLRINEYFELSARFDRNVSTPEKFQIHIEKMGGDGAPDLLPHCEHSKNFNFTTFLFFITTNFRNDKLSHQLIVFWSIFVAPIYIWRIVFH